ncbi:MAG: hypothetical protein KFH98_11730 [Gemmatimonadetes bacterium]|nr:hypothetical protein [Gemmatimonadota bacterium]
MISTLLTLFIVGIVALLVLSVMGALLGIAVGLLFKVLPILIVGYVVIRLLAPRQKKLSAEDRAWLER